MHQKLFWDTFSVTHVSKLLVCDSLHLLLFSNNVFASNYRPFLLFKLFSLSSKLICICVEAMNCETPDRQCPHVMRKLSKLKPYPNSPSNLLCLTLNVTAKQLPVQISAYHKYFWTHVIKKRSPIAIAEPVMTTSLTMLVVCLTFLCSCVFILLDYPCYFS